MRRPGIGVSLAALALHRGVTVVVAERPSQTAGQAVHRETPEQRNGRERERWNRDVDARKAAKRARR